MAVDTYKGDSDGKKMARCVCWQYVFQELGVSDGRFFTLASRLGGDVSCLLGSGVTVDRILAAERNAEAAMACGERWPGLRVIVGDALDVFLANDPKTFDCCMLDFCGPLGVDVLACFARCAAVMRAGAMIVIGFMRGRERNSDKGLAPSSRAWRRSNKKNGKRRRSRTAASSFEHEVGSRTEMLSQVRTGMGKLRAMYGAEAKHCGGTLRVVELLHVLETVFPELHLECTALYDYQSATDDSNGVPMTYAAFKKRNGPVPTRDVKTLRFDTEKVPLRTMAIALELDGNDAAMMLDIPAATVAAWKAHYSRGTYGDITQGLTKDGR